AKMIAGARRALCRTVNRHRALTGAPLTRTDVLRMVQRRARAFVWAAVGALLLIRHGFSPLVLAPSQGPGRENSDSAPVTPERVAATKVE
ncbi:MAG: hypothetical protein ACE5MH_07835, partial [Terriglobia bacterium]